jgi:hypothetical protein
LFLFTEELKVNYALGLRSLHRSSTDVGKERKEQKSIGGRPRVGGYKEDGCAEVGGNGVLAVVLIDKTLMIVSLH